VHLVWTLLIGLAAGLVAKLLMPGTGPRSVAVTALLGIVGSLAATFLGQVMGLYAAGQSGGFIGAVVGSALLLLGYHLVARK
jgi:uncharacterized membrane protein YeaQ/YmgE (transglycosylase-associated protein family)